MIPAVRVLWRLAPLGPIFLVATVVAVLLLGYALVRSARLSINVDAFLLQIHKLVNAGNIDRAVKLTTVIGALPTGKIVFTYLSAHTRGHGAHAGTMLEKQAADEFVRATRGEAMFRTTGMFAVLAGVSLLVTSHGASVLAPVGIPLAVVVLLVARSFMWTARLRADLIKVVGAMHALSIPQASTTDT